jgi:hypothetical protein
MFDPGFDLRTLISVAVGAMVTFAAVRFSRWFWRGERWWFKLGRWFRGVVTEALKHLFTDALTPIVAPPIDKLAVEFAQMRAQLKNLADDNDRAHAEVAKHLAAHDEQLADLKAQAAETIERIKVLESRRRDDRPPEEA